MFLDHLIREEYPNLKIDKEELGMTEAQCQLWLGETLINLESEFSSLIAARQTLRSFLS